MLDLGAFWPFAKPKLLALLQTQPPETLAAELAARVGTELSATDRATFAKVLTLTAARLGV